MNEMQVWIEKLKIYERLSEYALAFDNHDVDDLANCFTKDGVLGFDDLALQGHAQIRDYLKVQDSLRGRHITASPVYRIDPSGEIATGRATTLVAVATRSGYKVGFIGGYDDTLQKIDGEWRFSRRWVTGERLSDDPNLIVATADPDVAAIVRPLIDFYQRIGKRN